MLERWAVVRNRDYGSCTFGSEQDWGVSMSGSGGDRMGAEQWVLGTVHVDPEGIEDWQGRTLKCARMNQDLPGMRGGTRRVGGSNQDHEV